MADLFPMVAAGAPTMVFVDGENLAMRYADMVKERPARVHPLGGVWVMDNVAVWAQELRVPQAYGTRTNVIRHHYYTSVQGDDPKLDAVELWLKEKGIEAPRVFKRDKSRGSKQVDISLATEMLSHAHRKHYEVAVLVAGDADYIPLVKAVQREGARVHLWALSSGLSDRLWVAVDYAVKIDGIFGL